MTRLCSLQPNILTVQPSCASSKSRDAASFTPCLTFFTGRCYHSELLDSSRLHACASLGMAPTSQTFGRLLRENAGREHRDEASQAKQPWHWQSERAAIVQHNTPPLMKTPAPHCQQLNLPPPKSPGGGITCEWCTTGGSHGGRRRWQEWLRESEWGFFYYYFKGENKKSEGGGGLERDEAVASTNRPRTSGQSHGFLLRNLPKKLHTIWVSPCILELNGFFGVTGASCC